MNILTNFSDENHKSLDEFIDKFKHHDAVIITTFTKYDESKKLLNGDIFAIRHVFCACFAKHYAINRIAGTYIPYQTERKLEKYSLLIINKVNDKAFLSNLEKIAQVFEQDSILVIEHGENPTAYLLGTNTTGKIGLGRTEPLNPLGENCNVNLNFFIPLKQRKFYFADLPLDTTDKNQWHRYQLDRIKDGYPQNVMGLAAASAIGKNFLKTIGIIF